MDLLNFIRPNPGGYRVETCEWTDIHDLAYIPAVHERRMKERAKGNLWLFVFF